MDPRRTPMTWNTDQRLSKLTPSEHTDVAEVIAVHADDCTVALHAGGLIRVRGKAQVGDAVYLRGRVIVGPAPNLPGTLIEV